MHHLGLCVLIFPKMDKQEQDLCEFGWYLTQAVIRKILAFVSFVTDKPGVHLTPPLALPKKNNCPLASDDFP